ncbi:MAG: hypothetical protein ACRDGF_01355 [Chloroflexota bacterium]
MIRPSDLADAVLRNTLAQAEGALDESEYLACVRCCADAYVHVGTVHPELIARPFGGSVPLPAAHATRGPRRNQLQPWLGRLGVICTIGDDGIPQMTFQKQDFSMTEAAAYFEFMMDIAIRVERGASQR